VEHQVNDDKEHHDSDDISGIQGFASWTSVLGKPFMDVSAAEYVISPSTIDASLTWESRAAPGRVRPIKPHGRCASEP
jgi:hypothetical protein